MMLMREYTLLSGIVWNGVVRPAQRTVWAESAVAGVTEHCSGLEVHCFVVCTGEQLHLRRPTLQSAWSLVDDTN